MVLSQFSFSSDGMGSPTLIFTSISVEMDKL